MKLLKLAGPLLFSVSIVSPQTAAPAGNAPAQTVIRVDVNLRQVDLIVTDTTGNHVTDLRSSDFQLLEDGRPQQITNFSWVEVTPPPSGARLAALQEKPSLFERLVGLPKFRKTPGNDILAAPVANLRKEEIRRMIAIVAEAKPAPSNSTVVMGRVRKFIDEQIGPGDMVSIRSTYRSMIPLRDGRWMIRDSMGIFQQFTNDRRQLDAATERLPRVCMTAQMCRPDTVGAIMAAIRALQDLPGRKALLFVGTYMGPVDNIVSMANRAGVVIYVLDPEGHENGALAMKAAYLLAEKTGGRRIATTVGFDLTTAFNEVIEDLSGYYLLGYHPAVDESGSAPNMPIRHKIEVKVLRAGLTVRVRDGRMGTPDHVARPEPNPAAKPMGPEEILSKALFSVFNLDGIRVHLNPLFAASAPNPKNKRSPFVRAELEIDGRDVDFADAGDGSMRAVLDVVSAVFKQDGSEAGAASNRFSLLVSKERAAQIAAGIESTRKPVGAQGPAETC